MSGTVTGYEDSLAPLILLDLSTSILQLDFIYFDRVSRMLTSIPTLLKALFKQPGEDTFYHLGRGTLKELAKFHRPTSRVSCFHRL